jgi:hypothetical protein
MTDAHKIPPWVEVPTYTHPKGELPFANQKQTRLTRPTPATATPPTARPSLTELLNSWEPLSDEDAMPPIEDYPPEPFDIEWP